jgi:hypothetical protein
MTDRETTRQQREYLEKIHKYWLSLIPWEIPVLRPYEAETRAAQPFEIGGRLYPETMFFRRLESETKKLLGRAVKDIVEATDQPAILAALYETRRKYADIFRYWEKREALEPDTMTEADRRPLTLGDMEAANRKARERVEFIKNCEQSGVEVEIRPGAKLEKSVIGIVAGWIADNIEYLESMGVQPRRAGSVEVKQADNEPQPTQNKQQGGRDKYTAQICCVVCFLDLYADGAEVGKLPKKTALVEELAANYPQITQKLDSVRKEGSHHDRKPPKDMFKELCGLVEETRGGRIIADWKEAVTARSKHPEKTIKYIENEILIKRE